MRVRRISQLRFPHQNDSTQRLAHEKSFLMDKLFGCEKIGDAPDRHPCIPKKAYEPVTCAFSASQIEKRISWMRRRNSTRQILSQPIILSITGRFWRTRGPRRHKGPVGSANALACAWGGRSITPEPPRAKAKARATGADMQAKRADAPRKTRPPTLPHMPCIAYCALLTAHCLPCAPGAVRARLRSALTRPPVAKARAVPRRAIAYSTSPASTLMT